MGVFKNVGYNPIYTPVFVYMMEQFFHFEMFIVCTSTIVVRNLIIMQFLHSYFVVVEIIFNT